MAERLYQMIEDTRYEMVFKQRTLEDSTDVLYSEKDMRDQFNIGVKADVNHSQIRTYINYDTFVFIKLDAVIDFVSHQFANSNTIVATIELSFVSIDRLVELNSLFKLHGCMYSPSKAMFIRWKEPKPSKPKLSKQALLDTKRQTIGTIGLILRSRYQIHLDFMCPNESQQLRILRLGQVHGIDLDYLSTHKCFCFSTSSTYCGMGRNTLSEQLKLNLLKFKGQEDMYDQALASYTEWYNSAPLIEIKD